MTKRHRLALLVMVLAGSLMPKPAYAHAGWWDWLDAFSGPGPFVNGWTADMRFACKVTDDQGDVDAEGEHTKWVGPLQRECLTNANTIKSYLEIRGGRVGTGEKALFDDRPGELVGSVHLNQMQGMAMRQLDPALAIGAGAGVLWFSGSAIEGKPTRFTLTPFSVAFLPIRLFARGAHATKAGFLAVRFEEIMVMGSLDAQDFNAASHSSFKTKRDLVRSVSITLDVFSLLR